MQYRALDKATLNRPLRMRVSWFGMRGMDRRTYPFAARTRPILAALAMVVLAPSVPGRTMVAVPAEVLQLERLSMDDPRLLLADDPAGASTPDAKRLRSLVRRVLGATTRENFDGLDALLQEGLSLAVNETDAGERCLLQVAQIAEAQHRLGADAARTLAINSIGQARAQAQTWCVSRLEMAQAHVEATSDRTSEALALLKSALQGFEAEQNPLQLAGARNELMWIYRSDASDAQSVQRAIELGRAALAEIEPAQQRLLAATIHHNLMGAYLVSGDLARAREHARAAWKFASALEDQVGLAYISRLQAQIDLAENKPEEALASLVFARQVFHQSGDRRMEASVRLKQARALFALKRMQELRSELPSLRELIRQAGSRSQEVDYCDVALDVATAEGDAPATAAAARAYARALRELEQAERSKLATELRERMGVDQREAENRLLLAQQAATQARQRWLLITLGLSLVLVAGLCWHLLQQRRVRRSLKALAETDELTGLPNRRAILETLAQASHAPGFGPPTTLALVDIDFFKRVNDLHGHAVGDTALKVFALACRSQLRGSDAMGRFGGEEFLVVLPGTPLADAQILFERMRKALQHTEVPGLPPEQRLSCSMGCAELPHGGDLNAALARADAALYRAKAAGRDRVELAASPD